MKVRIHGRVGKQFVYDAIAKAQKVIEFPKNIEFYVFDNIKFSPVAVAKLPKSEQEFELLCEEEQASLSLSYGKRNIIMVYIGARDSYLRDNKKAFVGVVLHEVTHSLQGMKKNMDEKVRNDAIYSFEKFEPKLKKLNLPYPKLLQAYAKIGRTANFVLKDIYANNELIDKKIQDYMLEDYFNLYIRFCPIPSHKLKHPDFKIIIAAINFELQLVSVIAPILKLIRKNGDKQACKLLEHINQCYRINLPGLRDMFDKLSIFASNSNWSRKFRRKYYDRVFEDAYKCISQLDKRKMRS